MPPAWTLVFYAMCHCLMLDSTVSYLFFIHLRNLGLSPLSIVHNKGYVQMKGINIFQIIWKKRRNIFSLLWLTNAVLLTEECKSLLSHKFLKLEVLYFDYQTSFLSFLVFFAMLTLAKGVSCAPHFRVLLHYKSAAYATSKILLFFKVPNIQISPSCGWCSGNNRNIGFITE